MSDRIVETAGSEEHAAAASVRESWCDALERRGDDRRRLRGPARLATRKGSYAARVRDVSPGGAFVETHAALAIGDPVLLQVKTERGPLRARGVVVHRRSVPRSLEGSTLPGVGLRLEDAAELWATLLGLR